MNNRSNFLNFTIDVAKKAGQIQMSYFGKISPLYKKSNNIDLLTNADLQSEDYIIKQIEKTYPNHSILSEEQEEINNNKKYKWIIDPLDGTTNFAHNLPIFSVSIGLLKDNKPILGVVYNPAVNKCFYAERNKGSYLDNKKISVSTCSELGESLIATGFPYNHDKKYDLSFKLFKEFYDTTRGIRRLGAAALDLCFVAMGRFDGFYEFGLKPWDICAGIIIVKEAGGKVTDWDNGSIPFSGERILATNKLIHKNMSEILNADKYNIFK